MFLSILRSVGSVVAGLVVAIAFTIAAEVFSAIYHPFPPGIDYNDMEACKAHVARYPTWVLAACAAIWAAAPFCAAWLATRLGTNRHPLHGYIVGALLLAAACFNMAMLPYPMWFPIVVPVTFYLGSIWGTWLARGAVTPKG